MDEDLIGRMPTLPDDGRVYKAIVVGYGPVGRCITEILEDSGIEVHVLELNAKAVEMRRGMGKAASHGDVADPQTLLDAGLMAADALMLAIPNETLVVEVVKGVRNVNKEIYIAARTNYLSQGMMAKQAGANHVTIEEVVTATEMSKAVMMGITLGESY